MAADDAWSWFATRRPRRLLVQWDAPLAPSFVATGGAALALSVLVHGGVVAVAFEEAHGAVHAAAARPAERLLEVNADDLTLEPPETAPAPLAAPAGVPRAFAAAPVHHTAAPPPPAPAPAEEPALGAASPVVDAPAPRAPRFVMAAPALSVPGSSAPAVTAGSAGSPAALPPTPLDEHAVDVPAKLVAGTPPAYPPSAEAAGVEANVPVELVVSAAGSVQSAVALARVGYGLDEAALTAVRHYRFAPARRAGVAVAVRMRWVVRFELR
jgi:protein TonB